MRLFPACACPHADRRFSRNDILKALVSFVFVFTISSKLSSKEANIVTVRIFSKYSLTEARVKGKFQVKDAGKTVDTCRLYAKRSAVSAYCGKQKFTKGILHLQNLNGSFIVKSAKLSREYRGSLSAFAEKNTLVLINHVSVEDYINGIIKSEMPFLQPEALKAQSVVSRTWIYKNRRRHENYDFCDLTHCQVYKGKSGEGEMFVNAVKKTKGMILTMPDSGQPADVFYHSTCGGKTTAVMSEKSVPSLSYVNDTGYCTSSPHAVWEFFILKKEAENIFRRHVTDMRIVKRDPSGRALIISLKSSGTETKMPLQAFYRTFGKSIGWNKLKSAWFDVSSTEHSFVFKGKGLGHGAGLCQWGAYFMAKEGKNYVDILKHYFPLLRTKKIHDP